MSPKRKTARSAIVAAWNALWEKVKHHPEILRYHESQIAFEMGFELLLALEEAGLARYKDFDLIFDTAHEKHYESGEIEWGFNSRTRPDIYVRIFGEEGGFLLEIKRLHTWPPEVGEFGPDRWCDVKTQLEDWHKDIEKQRLVTASYDHIFDGFMLTFHQHIDRRGDIKNEFKEIPWDDEFKVPSRPITIRRSILEINKGGAPVKIEHK